MYFIFQMGGLGVTALTVAAALIGPAGALFQGALKSLLVYSSVFGVGWILRPNSRVLGFSYLFIYAVGLIVVVWCLRRAFRGAERTSGRNLTGINLFLLFVALISLSGIPPLLGFYAKLPIILELTIGRRGVLAILLFGSGVFLYVYIRVCIRGLSLRAQRVELGQLTRRGPMLVIVALMGAPFLLGA